MITILGAGGAIGGQVARLLETYRRPFRLVSRRACPPHGAAQIVLADLTNLDQTVRAVSGSSVVYLLAGLKYDHRVWLEVWPKLMSNTIEACKRAGARLVFFDNVYPYGKVAGPMTEETPFNPCSAKGEVRARIAATLIAAWTAGHLTGLIARSADFYGPFAANGVPNLLVFEPLSKGKRPSWLVNDSVPHSLTFTPDAARGLLELSGRDSAWNQTWHLPTAPNPPTGRELIALAAEAMGAAPGHRVLGRTMIRIGGWFDPMVAESYEMLYQSDSPYLFDSGKYAREFGFAGTPYADGVRAAAAAYRPGVAAKA